MSMIPMEDYDPALKNCWWIEGTDISSNAYLIDDGKVLIDTGNFQGIVPKIDEEFDVSRIEKIILTHSHYDHVGGLTELLYHCNPDILAHRNAFPLIHFEQFSFVKLMEKSGRMEKIFPLRGGERITAGPFELEVIHVPGHTLDHIGIYEPGTKSLFSGDMVFPATHETNTLSAPDPKLGDMDQLIDSLKRLLRYDVKNLLPGHGDPIFEAGGEHVKNALYQSIKDLEKMEDKAWLEVAQALADHGKLDDAIQCYEALLRLAPGHGEALLHRGLALTEKGEFEQALAHFDYLLERTPDWDEALIGKGFALMGLGRTDEALQIGSFREKLKALR